MNSIKLKISSLLIFFSCWGGQLNAQSLIDTLKYNINKADSDTLRLKLLVEFTDYCEITDIPKYTKQAITLADKLLAENKYDSKMLLYNRAMANNNNGFYYHFIGDHRSSIKYYNLSLKEFTDVPDSSYMALVYNNLAMVYNDLGDVDTTIHLLKIAEFICLKHNYIESLIPTYSNLATYYNKYGDFQKSIEYSNQLLKIHQGLNNVDGIVHTYNNLSSIYYVQNNYLKAEKYILKALSFKDQLFKTEALAIYYYNLSSIQSKLNKDSLAFINATESLNINKEIYHLKGIGDSYKLLGGYYLDKKEYNLAIAYSDSAHQIYTEINFLEGLSTVNKSKSFIYYELKDYQTAKKYGLKSLDYANQLGYPTDIKHASGILYKIYKNTGDYKNALEMLELKNIMTDSIERVDKKNETYKLQIDFEYTQKSFKDSLKNASEKELSRLKLNEKNAQLEKEQTRNTALIFSLIVLFASVIFIIRAYRKKKELARTIAIQKEEVEQKNKEITDSINYASKIQNAILASKSYLDKVMDSYFMFYKPKDIVSGDFYWVYQTESNKLIVAIVDCTGHGVPGAFMSMIGNSLLNKIIIENKVNDAATILNKLRSGVIKALSQSDKDSQQRDGMDIALMVLDKSNNTIEFAGANNPLWIVTKNDNSAHISEHKKSILTQDGLTLLELKPNKFPIGKYVGEIKPFESIVYQLANGDCVYMATDGFADQFGGDKNKKYKYKTLKKFILSINQLPFNEHNNILSTEFENWMGDNEQLDDVCNFGYKIT